MSDKWSAEALVHSHVLWNDPMLESSSSLWQGPGGMTDVSGLPDAEAIQQEGLHRLKKIVMHEKAVIGVRSCVLSCIRCRFASKKSVFGVCGCVCACACVWLRVSEIWCGMTRCLIVVLHYDRDREA